MAVKSKARNVHRMSAAPPVPRSPSRAINCAVLPCPRCGGAMILRTPWGARIGESFWGCTNYPRCHGTLKIDQG